MNSADLRYGNIVKSKSGVYLVVTEIMASGITYDRLDGTAVVGHAGWGEIEGVDLTGAWLEKMGFKHGGKDVYVKDHFKIGTSGKGANWLFYFDRHLSLRDMSYVHQLQNLYVVLTNTELKITL